MNIFKSKIPETIKHPAGKYLPVISTIFALTLTTVCVRAQIEVATPAFAFGSAGAGDGQFSELRGVSASTNGDVFVTDALNYRIQQFSANGTYLNQWGYQGENPGELDAPLDLAFDDKNNLFVLDTYNDRIQKFDVAGNLLTNWGSRGSAVGRFSSPRGITVDHERNVFVADTDNHRIQKFSNDGAFLAAMGSAGTAAGRLRFPVGIVVDKLGNIYVADQGNFRVQKFSKGGAYLTHWGRRGRASGQFEQAVNADGGPNDTAVDEAGNVWVADGGNNRIQVFTSEGTFLAQFGQAGAALGEFNLPARLAFDPAWKLLYVTDVENERVQAFNYTVPPPAILSITRTGTSATLTWSGIPGRAYQVQSKGDLSNGTWSNLAEAVTPTAYPATASLQAGPDAARFLRVALLP